VLQVPVIYCMGIESRKSDGAMDFLGRTELGALEMMRVKDDVGKMR
jgi:hypothetical protein